LRSGAVLILIGVVNLPIIKFSVDWWNTLHQQASVTRFDTPALHPAILTPLLWMAAAYTALFVVFVLWRMRAELAAQKLRVARATA
jgi:heme exporter protein C